MEDRYLGDGVYASFDGWHILLDLRGQDITTRIALEPEVMHSLFQYNKDILGQGSNSPEVGESE